ncbi:MAG: PDZ domain-containing protein [bacterium]|nr:PDZ domain-containing protein [bacterium]
MKNISFELPGFLGAEFVTFYKEEEKGAIIQNVAKNSPAEKAGIKTGDIVIKIDNAIISSGTDFRKLLRGNKPGDTLIFEVLRKKKKIRVMVVLSDLPIKERFIHQARIAYGHKEYNRSASLYEKAIKSGEVSPFILYSTAGSFALAGNREKAFDYLKKTINRGFYNLLMLKENADFKSLHNDRLWKTVTKECSKELKKALERATIFIPNRKWKYKTQFLDKNNNIIDCQTVALKVLEGSFVEQQIKASWNYDKTSQRNVKEETGIMDFPGYIWIHPPRKGKFAFTQFAPFPQIRKPFKEGNRWESTLILNEKLGKLAGLEIKWYYEITKQKDIPILPIKSMKCWQINGVSKSKLGVYKVTYYFHPKYGFVRWEYTKPDSAKVILDLEKVSGF